LNRIKQGMENFQIVLMCAEKEPLECHRTILVSRHLVEMGISVEHIHIDGTVESHTNALDRLLRQLKLEADMFRPREDLITEAYKRQEERIAYAFVTTPARTH